MKALAAGRRHRAAPVILVLLALILTGALYATVSPSQATAQAGDSAEDIEAGRTLFQANCSTCHGMNGEGTDAGPSLVGVGAASVDFQVSTGRMPMAMSGPQVMERAPQFDRDQVLQMAAYVHSLGPGPAIPAAEDVDPAGGDPANGMALFRTNCAMCHNSVGAGGALSEGRWAPALHDVNGTQIWEAMRTGPQNMPVFAESNIDNQGTQDIIAYLYEVREPTPGGFNLGSLGPAVEGMWAWLVGIGGLIVAAVWIGARAS